MRQSIFACVLVCTVAFSCAETDQVGGQTTTATSSSSTGGLQTQSYTIVNKFPHDPTAFTQGLVWHNGSLYEGTGQQGKSSLREVNLSTGAVIRKHDIAADHFGEGIAILNGKVYQVTWTTQKGFVYDLATFKQTATRTYEGEGWGLTTLGDTLILSDGTSKLRFLDPATFKVLRTLDVTAAGQPVRKLNELEMIKGELWANVWESNQIARIDPNTGVVRGWVDLTGLLSRADQASRTVDVLNGIAYDADRDRIFVTGKLWPMLYEVKVK